MGKGEVVGVAASQMQIEELERAIAQHLENFDGISSYGAEAAAAWVIDRINSSFSLVVLPLSPPRG